MKKLNIPSHDWLIWRERAIKYIQSLGEYINEIVSSLSQKADITALNNKQDTLQSGTNIKTINDQSLLGSGNIVIGGGGEVFVQEQADWNEDDSSNVSFIQNKPDLFSGSYNDLTDKPTIPTVPTNVSAFTNDAGYLTQHQDISGKADIADLATVATSGSYNDLSNKPTIPELVQADWEESSSSSAAYIQHKPTIPAAQVNADWDASSGIAQILNKPTIPDAQIQSDWEQSDNTAKDFIKNKPTIPDTTNLIQKSQTAGLVKNDGTIDTTQYTANAGTITSVKMNGTTISSSGEADLGTVLTSHQDISGKYDKTGGEISGNVKIDGNLTLDIDDPDYDSGIEITKVLDTNAGTILSLRGYANAQENTNYKPIIRNIGTPIQNYDAATKKYVDDHVVTPTYHLVELNLDGSVKTAASTLVYSTIASNLTNPMEADYLDIIWENGAGTNQFTRFYVPCIGINEVNSGDLLFEGTVQYTPNAEYMMVFRLNSSSQLSTSICAPIESHINKKNSIVAYPTSTEYYPSTKAVYDEFQRKPVVVWETNSTGLTSSEQNIGDSPTWQLTNLDMTPFKRIKIYTKSGRKDSGVGVDASNTPGVVLEMSLDSRAASPTGGHYLASVIGQKPNDPNRFFSVTCAVSSDKTSFAVLRMSSLYGTAATGNSDANGYVFLIEGYYD